MGHGPLLDGVKRRVLLGAPEAFRGVLQQAAASGMVEGTGTATAAGAEKILGDLVSLLPSLRGDH